MLTSSILVTLDDIDWHAVNE